MKSLYDFLRELQHHGITLWNDEGYLAYDAPDDEVLTPALLAELRERKAEILQLLANTQRSERSLAIPKAQRNAQLPLSYAQQRLWFLDELGSGAAYNMPTALEIEGKLEIAALQQALTEIVRRHESLRTTFTLREGVPHQVIHPPLPFALPVVDLRDMAYDAQTSEVKHLSEAEALKPFDLTQDLMLRAQVLQVAMERFVLLLTMHHIAADGWSMGVLMRELATLYMDYVQGQPSTLLELPIQYADFALWQRDYLQREALERQLGWWKAQLAGAPDLLQLPSDRPRPAHQSFRGSVSAVQIEAGLTQQLRQLSRAQGCTLYMTLLAAFQILLYRYTGQEQIVVGSPIANRNHQELEGLIGFFANIMALRTNFTSNLTFRQVLTQVQTTTQAAYDHQDLPFERLVEALQPERSLTYNPVVQVLFALQNAPMGEFAMLGVTVKPADFEIKTTRFDLEMHIWEIDERLQVDCIYSTDLFAAATIQRMVEQFENLLAQIVREPNQPIAKLALSTTRAATEGANGPTRNDEEVERCLLQSPAVHACCIVTRVAETLGPKPIAYVVPTGSFSAEELETHLRTLVPVEKLPYAYMPVAALPLTDSGGIDLALLQTLPVIDHNLPLRWENQWRAVPGIRQVTVVAQPQHQPVAPLHLTALLPEQHRVMARASPALTPAAPTATLPSLNGQDSHRENTMPAHRLALSDGGPLTIPADAPRTLGEALQQTAATYPSKGIVYLQADGSTSFQSYATLLTEARCILTGLSQLGLTAGDRVILQIENLRDYFPTLWACILAGITPVTVAVPPSYDAEQLVVKKLVNVWQLLEQPIMLASETLLQPLRKLVEASPVLQALTVMSITPLRRHPPSVTLLPRDPDAVVFCQLSSGSTGVPKCIQATHRGIITHIHAAAQFNNYHATDVTLNWLPVDHVVPLLTCHLKDVYLGCQQIEIPTNLILANPLVWLDAIERYRVTHTWSPNFGFKLVNDALAKSAGQRWDLTSIKFFMNAGEQVTRAVVEQFLHRIAPFGIAAQTMQPAFGMAEVCTCITYQNHFALETGIHRVRKASLGDSSRGPRTMNRMQLSLSTWAHLSPACRFALPTRITNCCPKDRLAACKSKVRWSRQGICIMTLRTPRRL